VKWTRRADSFIPDFFAVRRRSIKSSKKLTPSQPTTLLFLPASSPHPAQKGCWLGWIPPPFCGGVPSALRKARFPTQKLPQTPGRDVGRPPGNPLYDFPPLSPTLVARNHTTQGSASQVNFGRPGPLGNFPPTPLATSPRGGGGGTTRGTSGHRKPTRPRKGTRHPPPGHLNI